MTSRTLEWKSNEALAVGKGATEQEFFATVGNYSSRSRSPLGVKASSKSMARRYLASTTLKTDVKPSASSRTAPSNI